MFRTPRRKKTFRSKMKKQKGKPLVDVFAEEEARQAAPPHRQPKPNPKRPDTGFFLDRSQFCDRENAFMKRWEQENKRSRGVNYGCGILQDLFFDGDRYHNRMVHKITKRERWIVATVIQWLGTNCGFGFLYEVFEDCNYVLTMKEKRRTRDFFAKTTPPKCNWIPRIDDPNTFRTSCQQEVTFDGSVKTKDQWRYCPHCGDKIDLR